MDERSAAQSHVHGIVRSSSEDAEGDDHSHSHSAGTFQGQQMLRLVDERSSARNYVVLME